MLGVYFNTRLWTQVEGTSTIASELNFREYTSVLSVYNFLKPQRIVFYTYSEIIGEYWNKILNFKNVTIEIEKVPVISTIGDKTVKWIQHIADYIKLSKVLEHGGLALDFDVFIINGIM